MVTQANYREWDKEEIESEDVKEEGQNIHLPSMVLDTFKIDTITPNSRKYENVEDWGMVTSLIRMGNMDNHTQVKIIRGGGKDKGKSSESQHTQQKDAMVEI